MRILFDNEALNAAITSYYESANYPASNIIHPFLVKRYQATADSDTITLTFDTEFSASSIFYGFTNATSIIVKFYDVLDNLLHTETIADPQQRDSAFFTQVDNISYLEIDVITDMIAIYLGEFGCGLEIQMPDPLGDWPETPVDNSEVSDSVGGQTLQNYVEPLDSYTFNFRDLERDVAIAIRDACKEVGIGGKLWVDAFEEDHEFMQPMYATLRAQPTIQKNGRRYDLSLSVQEAR
jgi:hypothetical protein